MTYITHQHKTSHCVYYYIIHILSRTLLNRFITHKYIYGINHESNLRSHPRSHYLIGANIGSWVRNLFITLIVEDVGDINSYWRAFACNWRYCCTLFCTGWLAILYFTYDIYISPLYTDSVNCLFNFRSNEFGPRSLPWNRHDHVLPLAFLSSEIVLVPIVINNRI
jgi:hypothetical protein